MAFLIGQPGVFPLLAGALETARLKSMAFKPLKLQCPSALSWLQRCFSLSRKDPSVAETSFAGLGRQQGVRRLGLGVDVVSYRKSEIAVLTAVAFEFRGAGWVGSGT